MHNTCLMLNETSPCRNSALIFKLINGLDKCNSIFQLKQIQALLTTFGMSQDDRYASKIVSFAALSNSGNIDYAYRIVLSNASISTISCWNTVIRGYSSSKNPNTSLSVFVKMLRIGILPDHMTYPFLAKASSRLSKRELGVAIHGQVVKTGYESDRFIGNSLIHMYGTCGDLVYAYKLFDKMCVKNSVSWNSMLTAYSKSGDMDSARELFRLMPEKDVVSWSSLIDGYVKSGEYQEAMEIFEEMMNVGPNANEVTMISVLCACARMGALDKGRAIHRYIIDKGLMLTLILCTALVDMYAKCGAIEEAMAVFRGVRISNTDVLIWNAIIGGFAMHGSVRESLGLLMEMQESGVTPDEITYLLLLTACAHGGLVKEAWRFFKYLGEHGMTPKSEHYASMVDVLARSGQATEAYEFICKMPIEPTASMLGALLNGCVNHGKLDLAEIVGRKLIELEPDHDGRYVGLSNVYSLVKRWDDARTMREAMERRGVKKLPGFSVIEMFGTLNRFIAHDKGHPNSEEIYKMLKNVVSEMKLDFDNDNEECCLAGIENS